MAERQVEEKEVARVDVKAAAKVAVVLAVVVMLEVGMVVTRARMMGAATAASSAG